MGGGKVAPSGLSLHAWSDISIGIGIGIDISSSVTCVSVLMYTFDWQLLFRVVGLDLVRTLVLRSELGRYVGILRSILPMIYIVLIRLHEVPSSQSVLLCSLNKCPLPISEKQTGETVILLVPSSIFITAKI